MEIIHLVLGKANPARMNGVNKVVHELATQQQSAGYAVEVWGFTVNPVHDYPSREYQTKLFRTTCNPFGLGREWKRELLARKSSAIVQLHGGFIPRFYTAARFLKKNHIPYLITPHGNYNARALQRGQLRKLLYFKLFEKSILNGAGAIHFLGQSEVDSVQTLFPNVKSALIPYGFSTVPGLTNTELASEFTIGFCGRLDMDHKGLDQLIQGFASFQKDVPSSRLWLIGDGPHRDELEKLTHHFKVKQVVFWGSRFGQEKFDLLNQCSLFVHPSRYEGLPVAVLEAAAIGLPCLVSKATNLGQTIEEFKAGLVIKNGTADEIAEAMSDLYHQWMVDRMERLRENARSMVKEAFNWPKQLQSFHRLYQSIWQRA